MNKIFYVVIAITLIIGLRAELASASSESLLEKYTKACDGGFELGCSAYATLNKQGY